MSLNSDQSPHKSNTEAEIIRDACISAAREGFMDASISGLCHEGAVEAAIGAIQNLDLTKVLASKKDQ
ncbi:MAG: acetyltransferase [Balneola sp.]|nr:acetyltransferase [Balneola sp.]MBO6649460.1 acetyltransferase [Balneola sp.]MBO6711275.1 acetyltransferase [Balneola sp.]MBO6800610.1 acetyltransferase [Balneola sp.]MBO6869210.1 acetyltransferase [Balneola sp.]